MPPCPVCGDLVERLGGRGPVPIYCSRRCRRRVEVERLRLPELRAQLVEVERLAAPRSTGWGYRAWRDELQAAISATEALLGQVEARSELTRRRNLHARRARTPAMGDDRPSAAPTSA